MPRLQAASTKIIKIGGKIPKTNKLILCQSFLKKKINLVVPTYTNYCVPCCGFIPMSHNKRNFLARLGRARFKPACLARPDRAKDQKARPGPGQNFDPVPGPSQDWSVFDQIYLRVAWDPEPCCLSRSFFNLSLKSN